MAQDTQLFGSTVEDNIAYGLEPDEYSQTQIEEAARRANAWEFIESFTHGTQQDKTLSLTADSTI